MDFQRECQHTKELPTSSTTKHERNWKGSPAPFTALKSGGKRSLTDVHVRRAAYVVEKAESGKSVSVHASSASQWRPSWPRHGSDDASCRAFINDREGRPDASATPGSPPQAMPILSACLVVVAPSLQARPRCLPVPVLALEVQTPHPAPVGCGRYPVTAVSDLWPLRTGCASPPRAGARC